MALASESVGKQDKRSITSIILFMLQIITGYTGNRDQHSWSKGNGDDCVEKRQSILAGQTSLVEVSFGVGNVNCITNVYVVYLFVL